MRCAFVVIFALICAGGLPAQQPSVGGPVEAITFDAPTRSVRAVIGFPGAASFGPVLLDSLDFASVATLQSYGLVFESGKCLFVSGLGSKTISSVAIAGVTAYPDGVVWSRNGLLAILFSRTGGWFQIIAGFPNAPVAGALVDVSSLRGAFTALAVDAPGKQIVLAVSGPNGAVYRADGGQFTPLAYMAKPVSLSFSNDGQTLYALDAATLRVTAASLSGNGLQTLALPGMTNPIAIQSFEDSQNRQLLYVAGGSDRVLRILDVASQQTVTDVPLYFQPTGLDPFGSSSFVLAPRSQSANPLWLFTGSPQPGAYFVPAIQLRPPDHRSTAIAGRAR
jgi:WD40 repeat protein